MENNDFIIADIGDTNILLWRANKNKNEIVMVPGQGRTLKTAVCFFDNCVKFCFEASNITASNEGRIIYDFKSAIGTNEVLLQYKYQNYQYNYQAIDVLALYFYYISNIEKPNFKKFVFPKPFLWEAHQEQVVKDAAEIAGVDVELLDSNKALAFCYYRRLFHSGKLKIAIIHSGETQTEFSIFEMSKGEIKLKLCETIDFGGVDLTNALGNHLIKRFKKDKNSVVRGITERISKGESPRLSRVFYNATKQGKENITEKSAVPFDGSALTTEADFKCNLKIDDLKDNEEALLTYNIVSQLIDNIKNKASSLYSNADLESVLDYVEIVGGNGISPFVKDLIETYFCNKITNYLPLKESVAEGAAFIKQMGLNGELDSVEYIIDVPVKNHYRRRRQTIPGYDIENVKNQFQIIKDKNAQLLELEMLRNEMESFRNNIEKKIDSLPFQIKSIQFGNYKKRVNDLITQSDGKTDIGGIKADFIKIKNDLTDEFHSGMSSSFKSISLPEEALKSYIRSWSIMKAFIIPTKKNETLTRIGEKLIQERNDQKKEVGPKNPNKQKKEYVF